MKTIPRLLFFLKPFIREVGLSILLGVGTISAGIGLMGTSAWLISSAALHPSVAVLAVAIVGVRFFGITRGVFRYFERLVSHSVNFKLLSGLRVWYYHSIEPLAPAGLQDQRSGDLLSRVMTDIETLDNFYIRVVSPPIVAGIVTLGTGWFVGSLNASLAGILVSGLLLAGVISPIFTFTFNRTAGKNQILARAGLNTLVIEMVQGLDELLMMGQGVKKAGEIDSASKKLANAQRLSGWAGALNASLNLLLTHGTLWLMLLAAIPLVNTGKLEGVLLAVVVLVSQAAFEAVFPLGLAAQNLQASLQSAERIFKLADRAPQVSEPPEPCSKPKDVYVQFERVSFRYAPELPLALEKFDLKLEIGQHIAIIGPSGAGKSTVLALLQRFWDYSEGKILLDGCDLRNIRSGDVRRMISVVSQQTYLFSSTLRQNLHLAAPDLEDEELIDGLRQVELQDWFANLPDGLDTWVGEHGAHLSVGERQRISVARALLQNAPLWLLDEPTAHLDTITERKLIDTILEFSRDRSLLWVTHRLVGLDAMDEIIVLDKGRVVERGTEATLLQNFGMYCRMSAIQSGVLMEIDGTNAN